MLSAALYARVHFVLVQIARGTAGAARIRHSLRPLIWGGREVSGKARAQYVARMRPHTQCRHPRRRVTQYSRDVSDRAEKPRRTGSSAFAEDDSGGWRRTIHVIASEAKQSMSRHKERMDCFVAIAPRNDAY